MTLYEINEQLRNFEFDIDEETGEILNADDLDELELSKNEKVENICLYIKNLRADAAAYKAEKDRFFQRERAAKNKADGLSEYLENMLAGETFESIQASVTYRKSEVVECEDASIVPADFLKYKEPELNRAEIKKAIKNGVNVKGCILAEKMNMQIK